MASDRAIATQRVLGQIAHGDRQAAADELLPILYAELRELAQSMMKKVPPGNSLQPTALVHEAYLRLVGTRDPGWDGRGHFFAAAAQAMRQILANQAQRKSTIKHGGGRQRVSVELVDLPIEPPSDDILAVHEALREMERTDARKASIVLYRYFAGLTAKETAQLLGVSLRTVEREWKIVRTLLFTRLSEPD